MSSIGVPQRVGPYRPLAILGRGGMGVVYRAEHVDHPGPHVALKVLLESAESNTEESRLRFEREARLLEGLRHPNIVSFLEVGLDGSRQYFAMELLEGPSLATLVGRPRSTIGPLLIQICEGLHYLAERAVVHRDLSPNNILIVGGEKNPVAKILDFGIAKNVDSEEPLHNLTRTGIVMGKPRYWSPEQLGSLGSSKLLDWRSDIYALGVIFFHCYSGRFPFECASPYEFASAHLLEAPPRLEAPADQPALPESLCELVARMLAKNPDERPEYQEIIEVLARVSDAEDTSATESTARSAPAADGPVLTTSVSLPWRRTLPLETPRIGGGPVAHHPRTWATGGAVLVGATALAIAVSLLSRQEPPPVSFETARGTGAAVTRAPGTGLLNLDALPWARVEAIVDDSTGRRIPVAEDLSTPVSLEIPAGRYRVELVAVSRRERRSVTIDVKAGGTTSVNEAFGTSRELLGLLD